MLRFSQAVPALLLLAPVPSLHAQDDTAAPPASAPAVLNLSLDEAVERALKNNADIAVARFEPETSSEAVRERRGAYDPTLFSTLSQNSNTTPARDVFTGGEKVNTDTTVYNVGARQLLPTGGSLSLEFNNFRRESTSFFSTFNPLFDSGLDIGLSQPLLRNRAIDSPRFQLRVARRNLEISEVQFQQTVLNTLAGVKQRYYDLLTAIDNLEAQRKSLSLAQRLQEENEIRVRVGTMAPLDVVAAESEVASREEAVIVAEAALREAEDALRQAIFPDNDPATWTTSIVPTDRPTAEPVSVNTDEAVRKALAARTDLVAARKNLENAELSVKLARNQALPAVDLVANYGTSGIGGTQVVDPVTQAPLPQPIPGGFGNALSDVFAREFPTWSFGVNVSYPLFNRQAGAARAQARISHEQAQANIRRLEMQVTAEVRSAARAVETNWKRVESTRAARVLSERRLDAEQKKFAAGLSTNFLVTQAQRDLAVAEVAELRAVGDYRKSLVNFERVQQAGGGSVSFASTGGSSRTSSSAGATDGGGSTLTGATGQQPF